MTRADEHHARAVARYDAGEFAEAAALAWKGLQDHPDDGRLWQLYGTACHNLGDHESARAALETASCLVPLHPLAQLALARCYARQGQGDLARTIYVHLARWDCCPGGLLPAVAAGLGALGEDALALEVCEAITDRNPTHHQAHFGVAYYLNRLGAPAAEVIPPLALALDLAPHVLSYRLNLAFVLAEVGRHDEASTLLAPVSPVQVTSPCMLRRMADLYEQAGDLARASACLRQLACRHAR